MTRDDYTRVIPRRNSRLIKRRGRKLSMLLLLQVGTALFSLLSSTTHGGSKHTNEAENPVLFHKSRFTRCNALTRGYYLYGTCSLVFMQMILIKAIRYPLAKLNLATPIFNMCCYVQRQKNPLSMDGSYFLGSFILRNLPGQPFSFQMCKV